MQIYFDPGLIRAAYKQVLFYKMYDQYVIYCMVQHLKCI